MELFSGSQRKGCRVDSVSSGVAAPSTAADVTTRIERHVRSRGDKGADGIR